ncbi:thiamine diphosphokinase [Roseovarius autotrophicus]|uniref:thiamine diphosphokinase n=1 Tax=Roseovarius autotrophicus TaxID=2824121 RepID=UPI001B3650F7|nr:thiamine diphosphokinase [Roseovarius autotrophicus]
MIVREKEPISLIGGASVSPAILRAALRLAPVVVAADGGANTAVEAGLVPRAVIGDFDSITAQTRARLPEDVLHHFEDQETTDFEKCLTQVTAPLLIGLGFVGDRLDHQMAACTALVRHAAQRCILLGEADLMFLCPPSLVLPLAEGCRVSLFPMGAVEGASDGLRWPIGGLNLAPDGRIATSNLSVGPVSLAVTAPKMLVILPAETLDIVVPALRATPATWTTA